MTGRNIRREYATDSFYHIYNRGVNKNTIFHDDEDYRTYLNLFKRILSKEPVKDTRGREYRNVSNSISLNAFCLMPNHFHLLVHQKTGTAITDLMKSTSVSYSMYYNKKYDRIGPLFQSRFKASRINRDEYFYYIPHYIHLNPKEYQTWPYSSLPYYLGSHNSSWLDPSPFQELSKTPEQYLQRLSEIALSRVVPWKEEKPLVEAFSGLKHKNRA